MQTTIRLFFVTSHIHWDKILKVIVSQSIFALKVKNIIHKLSFLVHNCPNLFTQLQVSKLLGPFPSEFSKGECGDEFSQFIGTPLSQYERIQNLSKRFSKCTDLSFITLVERLLTYSPSKFSASNLSLSFIFYCSLISLPHFCSVA